MSDDFWDGTSSKTDLDLPAFFDSSVTEQLFRVLDLGVLLSLGLTRDRGAIGIAVFDDGRRRREYFRSSSDAADWLGMAASALSATGNGPPARDEVRTQKPPRGR